VNNLKESSNLNVWKADSAGNLKQRDAESNLKCDVATELEVFNALKRKGAAYELANLMSFEVHENIINLLFCELQRDATIQFKKVSSSQIAQADGEIHVKLAEATRAGLSFGPKGELPLDLHVGNVLALSSVMWLLMPKQKGHSEKVDRPHSANQPRAREPEKRKTTNQNASPKHKKTKKIPMPLQLRWGTPFDKEGRSLCFYNLGTCQDKNCKRGRHVCCHPGCFTSSHTFLTHGKGGA